MLGEALQSILRGRGLRRSPSTRCLLPCAGIGSRGRPGPAALSRSGGDGALFFSTLPLARSHPHLVLQCRLGRHWENSSQEEKGLPGGARALQMILPSPRQLYTFSLFFPGNATPPEDTGDIRFC